MTPTILVLGAGSIGRRHARNLCALGRSVVVTDPDADRLAATRADLPDVVRVPWPERHDVEAAGVVVASPTLFHADQARAAAEAGRRVLVEKPLATSAAEAAPLADLDLAVGFNLRFHQPLRRLADLVAEGGIGRPVSGRFWFGYHLPSWRPDVDYRTTYSARRDLGGGVLLDAIHEIDLAVWLFGDELDVVGAHVTRAGDLDIDVEDTVRALLITPDDVPVEIELDYLSRGYRRGVEIVGTDATVRLDWARQVIEIDDGDGTRTEKATDPVDRSYEAEATAFCAWLDGGPPLPVDAPTALASLALADRVAAP